MPTKKQQIIIQILGGFKVFITLHDFLLCQIFYTDYSYVVSRLKHEAVTHFRGQFLDPKSCTPVTFTPIKIKNTRLYVHSAIKKKNLKPH